MLNVSPYQASTTSVKQLAAPVVRDRRAFRHLTKSQRAAVAVAILRGEVKLQPTLQAVARVLDVSATYVGMAGKLSPEQLYRVRKGWLAIPRIRPKAKREVSPDDVAAWWESASDAERAAVIDRIGVTPVWDALAKNLA